MFAADRRVAFGVLSAVVLWAAPGSDRAAASVLEIRDDGTVIVYDGPAPTLRRDVRPVAAPLPRIPVAAARPDLEEHFRRAGAQSHFSPALLEAVAWAESRFNPASRSVKGAQGIMQLMPATAADLRVDPNDVEQNVQGGASYLRAMMDTFDGDLPRALAAYNAGPAAVRKYGGIPPYPETEAYVAKILERLAGSLESKQE